MEVLYNLLLSKTAESTDRLEDLKIVRIFQLERNGSIVCEGFDHRYLQGDF